MVCLSCHLVTRARICPDCARSLHPAPDRLMPGGVRVVAALEHDGAARALVHHLKYRGIVDCAEIFADLLVPRLPALPVVPIPRALSRRVRYGVDPARVIAGALAGRLGVPVLDALAPPIHARRRAGRDHSRPVRAFRSRFTLRFPVILVDDVVTTGATAMAAVDAAGAEQVRGIAAASVVPDMPNVSAA